MGAAGNGAAGAAVQFGTLAATLIMEAGALFNGQVVADASAQDRLELAGKAPGTLTGLGSAFTGFAAVQEDAGSTWTLTGSNTLPSSDALLVNGVLILSGTFANAGSTTIDTQAVLAASAQGSILLADVDLAGGRLLGSSTATLSIGTQAGGTVGGITIQVGAEIHGYGGINAGGVITDDGKILAEGGTLTIGQPIIGGGSLEIGMGAEAVTGGAVEIPSVSFASGGSGTFEVDVPAKMSADISGFGSNDVIDLRNLAADALSFMSGTLTLEAGGKVVDSLVFQGNYIADNFRLTSDGQGGSDIGFIANGDLGHADLRLASNGAYDRPASPLSWGHFGAWPATQALDVLLQGIVLHRS